jgi:hypothetical protein
VNLAPGFGEKREMEARRRRVKRYWKSSRRQCRHHRRLSGFAQISPVWLDRAATFAKVNSYVEQPHSKGVS